MAKQDWDSKKFTSSGGYLKYDGKFVARHKYRKKGAAPAFKKFLIVNFTPEEYFSLYNSDLPPLKILQTKGFMYPHQIKQCEEMGVEPTLDAWTRGLVRAALERKESEEDGVKRLDTIWG